MNELIYRAHKIMGEATRQDEYEQVMDELEAVYDSRDSADFLAAIERLRDLAQDGMVDAATRLGEALALSGPAHDSTEAYKWFYIGLSQGGYSIEFDDENHSPPHYCGPAGDFRNESMVSELVLELGFDRVRELDSEAAAWLDLHRKRS